MLKTMETQVSIVGRSCLCHCSIWLQCLFSQKRIPKYLAGSTWSVVKTKTTMPWQTLICRRVLTWLRTTVRSFFLRNVLSQAISETRYDTCWVVKKISVSVPTRNISHPFDHGWTEIKSDSYCQWPSKCLSSWKRSLLWPRCPDVTTLVKQEITHLLLTQYPAPCPSWLIAGAGLMVVLMVRSRSLGRSSIQKTMKSIRLMGLNTPRYCAEY